MRVRDYRHHAAELPEDLRDLALEVFDIGVCLGPVKHGPRGTPGEVVKRLKKSPYWAKRFSKFTSDAARNVRFDRTIRIDPWCSAYPGVEKSLADILRRLHSPAINYIVSKNKIK